MELSSLVLEFFLPLLLLGLPKILLDYLMMVVLMMMMMIMMMMMMMKMKRLVDQQFPAV